MAKKDINPYEQLVEEASEEYVALVYSIAEELAPVRPWWHVDLSPDQQIWRWLSGPRNEIMDWIYTAGAYMGWEGPEETLKQWEKIFTDPMAEEMIPIFVVSVMPIELLEMVQAAGPKDAGNHVRKMEKMVEGRAAALETLDRRDDEVINVPEPPFAPPPMPVELAPGTAGWPLYGAVPRDSEGISSSGEKPAGY